ncbi:MAG: glycoside hydrolase family 3 protein [Candidatus Cyclobacteriaceae bacterium M2_1C_046]
MRYIFLILLFLSTYSYGQQIDSLDFKIGQMILVGLDNEGAIPNENLLKEIRSGRTGGIIIFEKNIPQQDSFIELKKLVWNIQNAAPYPLFIAIDQEGGRVNRLKTKYGFPRSVSASYLGKLQNPDSTRFYAEITAATLAGLGINVNFAPVVDVAVNPDNPIIAKVERSYSAEPDSVVLHAEQVIKAHRQFNILPVLKHFPGHGSSHADTHLGIADVTSYWQKYELVPYQHMINSGVVEAIMTAHIVNRKLEQKGYPGTLSEMIITNLLRNKMGYDGLVFSDDMQMHAITKHYGLENAIELAIKAGVDVMIFSNNISGSELQTVSRVHKVIKDLISSGKIPEERINESYQRIMRIKSQW